MAHAPSAALRSVDAACAHVVLLSRSHTERRPGKSEGTPGWIQWRAGASEIALLSRCTGFSMLCTGLEQRNDLYVSDIFYFVIIRYAILL